MAILLADLYLDLECEYDEMKTKPRIKAGVLQSHSERLDNLEKLFLGQSLILRQLLSPTINCMSTLAQQATPEVIASISSSIGNEQSDARWKGLEENLRNLRQELGIPSRKRERSPSEDQEEQIDLTYQESTLKGAGVPGHADLHARTHVSLQKKAKGLSANSTDEPKKEGQNSGVINQNSIADYHSDDSGDLASLLSTFHAVQSYLPPDDLIYDLVEIHFEVNQPWIPVLHRVTFKQQMRLPSARRRLSVILNAIVVATSRFSKDPRLSDRAIREKLCSACRQYVLLQNLESYSVENVQAAIIVAFDSIGAGRGPRSWALVDSMSRTVEHLRLSFEEDEDSSHSGEESNGDSMQNFPPRNQKFMTRMKFLRKAESFIEQEERRRVFWNVFLLDRFCSISTGWNPSLTAVDVRRRLPINGEYWNDNIPHRGRYFGFQSIKPETPHGDEETPCTSSGNYSLLSATTDENKSSLEDEVKALGGFSYCVEASEFLSAVTQFFLQQDVHPQSLAELQEWMNGFKDLDLRLAQWKANLPAKWREVKVHPMPKLKFDPMMDQNLTLAHMTHNTSVTLLHQFVAYPVAQWQLTSMMRSSQRSSAETCLAAAKEICQMTSRYLHAMDGIVNPQFGFCLFVCGRMLLCHASFTKTELLAEFAFIVDTLGELARRWRGDYYGGMPTALSVVERNLKEVGTMDNLFARFQKSLVNARMQMTLNENEKIDIRAPVYAATSTREMDQTKTAPPSPISGHQTFSSTEAMPIPEKITYAEIFTGEGISLTSPPLPISFQADRSMLAPFLSGDLPAYSQANTRVNSPLVSYNDINVMMEDVEGVKQPDNGFNTEDLVPWFDDPQFSELDRVWTFGNPD